MSISGYSAGNPKDLGTRQSSGRSFLPGIGPLREAYSSYTFLGYGELPESKVKVSSLALEKPSGMMTRTDIDVRIQRWQLQ